MTPIDCPRCGELRETYKVRLRLPGGTEYQTLYRECFLAVTGEQPVEDVSAWRLLVYGASPMPEELIPRAVRVVGVELLQWCENDPAPPSGGGRFG
jgi:hypothetical protein